MTIHDPKLIIHFLHQHEQFWKFVGQPCAREREKIGTSMSVFFNLKICSISGADMTLAAKAKGGPPRKLLDPMKLTDDQLAHINMDWSPCTDPRFEQPSCGEGNGKPCTRKGCSGIFEKTGEPCQFCHVHSAEVIARFEAFRGFARRAAKKNVGKHANRRMGY
jgi:hypothetical protein